MSSEYRRESEEVYYAPASVRSFGQPEREFLLARAAESRRRRARLCFHSDPGEARHDMLIVHPRDAYVRPHAHVRGSEALHLVEGCLEVVLLGESGEIERVERLEEGRHGTTFFHVDRDRLHTLRILTDFAIFHESTCGPFDPSRTRFPDWAPPEDDSEGCRIFLEGLERALLARRAPGENRES